MERKNLFVFTIVAIMAVLFLAGITHAQDKMATPTQAKEMVKKIVSYTKQVGCEKAFAEFNTTSSPWNTTYKNAYASIGDWDGITLVSGRFPFLAGQNHISLKDADGNPFIKTAIEKCKKDGFASQNYKWLDAKTKKVEERTLIVEVVDCSGKKVDVGITYEGKI